MKLAVIGGGPAGMAAAVSAKESGVEDVVLIERHDYLGGVLPQCIHTGFGTQLYGEDYTGGEYAWLWAEKTLSEDIDVMTSTTVLSVRKDPPEIKTEQDRQGWRIKCVNASAGAAEIDADAVIIASGCRERTLPGMLIPGSRPAGIFTAGSAQLMMNMKNYLPGRSAVILGSGDIGLIMARRMTLEGIRVKLILGQEASGLARNIVQCVDDFDIPLRYGWTLVSTHGYRRLKGVTVAPLPEDGRPDMSRREYIPCDTLLVATGLVPELDMIRGYEANGMDNGLFLCGNANRVHDLADHVTEEGMRIGREAAAYLLGTGTDRCSHRDLIREEMKDRHGNMLCTVCPKGCIMNVRRDPFEVSGNDCPRGVDFAKQELDDPKRVLTSVVGTDDPVHPVLAVRTDRAVDRSKLADVMKAVKRIKVSGDFRPGDTVAENIADTGADLIATWYTGDPVKNKLST